MKTCDHAPTNDDSFPRLTNNYILKATFAKGVSHNPIVIEGRNIFTVTYDRDHMKKTQ